MLGMVKSYLGMGRRLVHYLKALQISTDGF